MEPFRYPEGGKERFSLIWACIQPKERFGPPGYFGTPALCLRRWCTNCQDYTLSIVTPLSELPYCSTCEIVQSVWIAPLAHLYLPHTGLPTVCFDSMITSARKKAYGTRPRGEYSFHSLQWPEEPEPRFTDEELDRLGDE